MGRYSMECGCTFTEDESEDEYCSMHASEQCLDCEKHQTEFNEYYMVHEDIWNSAVINNEVYGLLCIGCLEDRIGRELRPKDFTSYPVNSRENAMTHSWRQQQRMGYYYEGSDWQS